jgi:transcriptional regulator with XRE-family HTH domain
MADRHEHRPGPADPPGSGNAPGRGDKPYRERLRARLARRGLSGPRLTEVVARDLLGFGIRPRKAWRLACELSQEQAAERFNLITGDPLMPMTGSRIGDYERWPGGSGVRPGVPVLKTEADVYGTTWDQLVDVQDLAHMPDSDVLEYVERGSYLAVPLTRVEVPAPAVPARVPSRRRSREERVIIAVAAESHEFGEWVGMSEVADATIEQYAAQIQRLSRDLQFAHAGPLPALLELRQLRDRVASRLRGHQRLEQARDLYLIAAQVCGLLAWVTGDTANYRAADTHAWTAWMCAEEAGHDGARAWVRVTQAGLAYWDGRYIESAQLAEDGLNYPSADTGRTMLALFRARSLARVGRRDEVSQALNLAEVERDRVSAPALLGGVWGLTPARYHGYRAMTRIVIDDRPGAIADAAQTITLSEEGPAEEREVYHEMHAHLDQALAHLHPSEGELEGAASALRPVLELPADFRIDPVSQDLARVRRSLALPRYASTPLAQDLQEEIESYTREAIPRQLRA